MAPVDRPDLDRVVAVIDRLKDTTKVLETLVEVDGHPPLPAGLRVDSYILAGEGK